MDQLLLKMMLGVLLLTTLGVLGIVIRRSARRYDQLKAVWSEYAARRGLRVTSPRRGILCTLGIDTAPRIEGQAGGRTFSIAYAPRARHSPETTSVSVGCDDLAQTFWFQLRGRSVLDRTLSHQWLVPTGDAALDTTFDLFSNGPGQIAAMLTQEVRRDLVRLAQVRSEVALVRYLRHDGEAPLVLSWAGAEFDPAVLDLGVAIAVGVRW